MNILVLYASVFGNTEKVAQTIGSALTENGTVIVRKVEEVQSADWQELDAVVVGSPTRAFQATPALMKVLRSIPGYGLQGVKAAVFDTRADLEMVNSKVLTTMMKFFGYADQPIARVLKKKGATLLSPTAGFFVQESEGPLVDGELERASAWVKSLLAKS